MRRCLLRLSSSALPFAAILLLLVVATTNNGGRWFAAAQSSPSSAALCTSTFHETIMTATINNPPAGTVTIAEFPETSKHYQLECVVLTQVGPVTGNRQCASPPGQRLQFCHTPVAGETGHGTWTCADVSEYLNTEFRTVTIGSRNGPMLNMKFTWSSTMTEQACFPRSFTVKVVGLSVPDPGTEFAASMVFVAIVAVIAGGVVAYGAYAFWRVTKKFEHREDDGGERGLGSPSKDGGPQEAYKQALAALGAPPEIATFYDEGGDDNAEGDGAGEYYDEEEMEGGEGGRDEEDEDDDDGEYYDGDVAAHHPEREPLSAERRAAAARQQMMRGGGGGYGGAAAAAAAAGPTHAVLDNNTVVQSTAPPTPWFAKMQKSESIERSTRRGGGRRGGTRRSDLVDSDDDDYAHEEGDDYAYQQRQQQRMSNRQGNSRSRY